MPNSKSARLPDVVVQTQISISEHSDIASEYRYSIIPRLLREPASRGIANARGKVMNSHFFATLLSVRRRSAATSPRLANWLHSLALVAIFASFSWADGRFIVPVPSDNSSSGSSQPSASSSYSSPASPVSSGTTYSNSAPTTNDAGSTTNSTGRFIVPVPGHTSTPGNPPSGGHHGGGYRPHTPYWCGYYYWSGDYYYSDGLVYSPEYDRYSRRPSGSYSGYSTNRYVSDDAYYFPPVPPPLGAPLPPKTSLVGGAEVPAELAFYVNEPFYPQLGSRLATRDLSKKLSQRLETFRLNRAALLDELRSVLEEAKDASPTVRQERLDRLSARQTPRIQELETEADQFRTELLHTGLVGKFWGSGDWNDHRPWKMGVDDLTGPRDTFLAFEFQVVRAAIFFQEGLSPAQRRLLRELAMELQVQAFGPKNAATTPDESLVFFQPETSRIRILNTIPPEIAAKISVLEEEKNTLKKELRDALYQLDSATPSRRAQQLRQLAEKQEATFASVDVLAEDIRRGLALHPELLGPPTTPSFPPDLAARIMAYEKWKLSLQKVLQTKLEETRVAMGPEGAVTRRDLDAPGHAVVAYDATRVGSEERLNSVREAVTAFNRDYGPKFAALKEEQEHIRTAIAAWANTSAGKEEKRSVDDLLRDFEQSRRRQEVWQNYKDYQNAVLLPGLSPEQRRLLFNGAIEKLALPLPPGENVSW